MLSKTIPPSKISEIFNIMEKTILIALVACGLFFLAYNGF